MIHMRTLSLIAKSLGCGAILLLSGCASVKIPNIDFLKMPEFKDDVANISGYPDVSDAPERPQGLRTDEQWDAEAQKIIKARDSFITPKIDGPNLSDAQLAAKIRTLSNHVDEYKLDDPESMSK